MLVIFTISAHQTGKFWPTAEVIQVKKIKIKNCTLTKWHWQCTHLHISVSPKWHVLHLLITPDRLTPLLYYVLIIHHRPCSCFIINLGENRRVIFATVHKLILNYMQAERFVSLCLLSYSLYINPMSLSYFRRLISWLYSCSIFRIYSNELKYLVSSFFSTKLLHNILGEERNTKARFFSIFL